MIRKFEFHTLQEAWEGINEFLMVEEEMILSTGGARYGPEIISYNNFMRITKAWVDPKFDFGDIFGYRINKWNSLVNNYVDFHYLDLIKAEVLLREKKRAKSYNIAYHFSNSHHSGKDCLISLIFSRRMNYDIPILVFHIRSSEVTKRLLFDFLLVQRIKEYVYGFDQEVIVEFYAPVCYVTAENLIMYHNHRSIPKLLKGLNMGVFQKALMKTYKDFLVADPNLIRYKVSRRAAKQLQRDEHGKAISGVPSLLARNLVLKRDDGIAYPDTCITDKERRSFRKSLTK